MPSPSCSPRCSRPARCRACRPLGRIRRLGGARRTPRAQGDHAGAARAYEAARERRCAPARAMPLWLAAAREWLPAAQPDAAESRDRARSRRRSPPPMRANSARIDAEIALARGDTARAAEILAGSRRRRRGDARDPRARAVREPARGGRRVDPDGARQAAQRRRRAPGQPAHDRRRHPVRGAARRRRARARRRGPRARRLARARPHPRRRRSRARSARSGGCRPGASATRRTRRANRSGRALPSGPPRAGDRPRQVALLLPLSGRAAAAGSAVRDGFLGAYYDDGSARRGRGSASTTSPRATRPPPTCRRSRTAATSWSAR